jgi:lipopolysaccharide export system permease protein
MPILGHTIQRMILADLDRVFLVSLLALTGLFLMAGLVAEASKNGLSPLQIMMMMPLLIPNTLPFTIPSTTLFATCVVYGRVAHDNEVVALKAAGVNPMTLLRPCLILGLGTTIITGALYYHLIPHTHQVLRQQFLSDGEEVLYNVLKRSRCLRSSNLPYVMYVREVQGRRLVDVIFKKRQKHGSYWVGYDLVAWGREATLRVETGGDGKARIVVDMERCTVWGIKGESGYFKDRRFEVDLPSELTGDDKRSRPNSMTWIELQKRWDELLLEQRELQARIAAGMIRQSDPSTPREQIVAQVAARFPDLGIVERFLEIELDTKSEDLVLHVAHLANMESDTLKLIRASETETYMRPAISLGCLCFVLVGCPVGIWFSRADYLSSFVTCFLPTVFIYYPLLLCGGNLARDGKAPAALAICAADILFLMVAGFLIVKLMRR